MDVSIYSKKKICCVFFFHLMQKKKICWMLNSSKSTVKKSGKVRLNKREHIFLISLLVQTGNRRAYVEFNST